MSSRITLAISPLVGLDGSSAMQEEVGNHSRTALQLQGMVCTMLQLWLSTKPDYAYNNAAHSCSPSCNTHVQNSRTPKMIHWHEVMRLRRLPGLA